MSLDTVEAQFSAAMLADATINSLLSGRLYLVQLPQLATFPCASFQRISTTRNWVQAQGGQFADCGWIRFQLDIWAQTATGGQDASAIAQEFIRVLRTFNAYSSSAAGGSNRVMNQRMQVEPNTQPPLFRCILDLQIWFSDNS